MSRIIVNTQAIRSRLITIFMSTGVPQVDAATLADTLIDSEAEGRESHGLMRVPALYSRIVRGNITTSPDIRFTNIGSCIYSVDGDNALGAVLAQRTMEFCEAEARKHGIAVAAVKNANHLGAAGYYTAKAAGHGYFAFLASNAGPGVAPTGGMSKLLGTNPFSVSFPAGKYDNFTLDIATSASAYGKIMMYAKEGKPIPVGWAMDENGNDTTDAQVAVDAFNKGVGILPMSAHKGMGLSMIIDVLAGLMAGAKFSYQVSNMFSTSNISGVGFFCVVMDIERFMPLEDFISSVEGWFDLLKADKQRPGSGGIFMPGEIENMRRKQAGDSLSVFEGTIREIEKIEASISS